MKCRYCGAEMRLDDLDRVSPTSTDYYYQFDSCDSSCIVESSLDSSISYCRWHSENPSNSDIDTLFFGRGFLDEQYMVFSWLFCRSYYRRSDLYL